VWDDFREQYLFTSLALDFWWTALIVVVVLVCLLVGAIIPVLDR
jgi:hypothetical protein